MSKVEGDRSVFLVLYHTYVRTIRVGVPRHDRLDRWTGIPLSVGNPCLAETLFANLRISSFLGRYQTAIIHFGVDEKKTRVHEPRVENSCPAQTLGTDFMINFESLEFSE